MVRRTKKESSIITTEGTSLEKVLKSLSQTIGTEVALAVKEALKNIKPTSSSLHQSNNEVTIDESLIPMTIKQEEVEANLEDMAKIETKEDKDLDKSKTKLASMLKKRKK